MRKVLCLTLAACLLLSILISGVQATETEPVQTEATEPAQVTEPPETTTPTESTEPTDSTDPTEETDPTYFPSEPADPTRWPVFRPTGRVEHDRICSKIVHVYTETLKQTGESELRGLCGLEASWALFLLGINSQLEVYNGNGHYDAYCHRKETTGGYPIKAYSAEEYSMADALDEITNGGTKDVYNIMLCFEKTTSVLGQQYGHVAFVNAIVGGKVYFTEGYNTPFGLAGDPFVISIPDFLDFWRGWTLYEGLIYFGSGDAMAGCTTYDTDLFAVCEKNADLYLYPDRQDVLRTARTGERLVVTGLVEDEEGAFFYRIHNDGDEGYIPTEAVRIIRYNTESVILSDLTAPEALQPGEKFTLSGRVSATQSGMGTVTLKVCNADEEPILEVPLKGNAVSCDLGSWENRKLVDLSKLEEGAYILTLNAEVTNYYRFSDTAVEDVQTVTLWQSAFTVGDAKLPRLAEEPKPVPEDGWNYLAGSWYYYRDGAPVTGWLCSEDIEYYLDENGAAATGWTEVNGKLRFFTETGAMRTGWVQAAEGARYLLRNGVAAIGWKTVEGERYLFDEEGILRNNSWVKLKDQLYFLDENGVAATGWVDLPEGRFSFHPDGYLLSVMVDGKPVRYDGKWDPTATE